MMYKRFLLAILLCVPMLYASQYHHVDAKLWHKAVNTVRDALEKKQKTRAYKRKIKREHIAWLDPDKVPLQKVALKFKLMNHVMGAPKNNILESYINPLSQKRVKAFLKKHKDSFYKVEKKYRVDAAGIAGVLYIETGFNASYIKYYPALQSLLSLAALIDDDYRKDIVDQTLLLAKHYKTSEKWKKRSAWDERAQKIGEQWLQELVSLFVLIKQLSWEKAFVYDLQGSWAGAIGYSQFMPATAVKHIQSKDFNFWSWPESIEFTAKKLSAHDWYKDPKAALMQYNRVSWYGEAVLGILKKVNPWWDELNQKPKV